MTQRPTGSWLMYDQILLFLKQEFWNFTFWWESFLTDHWRKSFQGISSFFWHQFTQNHPESHKKTLLTPDQKLGHLGDTLTNLQVLIFRAVVIPNLPPWSLLQKIFYFVSPTIVPTESNYQITNFLIQFIFAKTCSESPISPLPSMEC